MLFLILSRFRNLILNEMYMKDESSKLLVLLEKHASIATVWLGIWSIFEIFHQVAIKDSPTNHIILTLSWILNKSIQSSDQPFTCHKKFTGNGQNKVYGTHYKRKNIHIFPIHNIFQCSYRNSSITRYDDIFFETRMFSTKKFVKKNISPFGSYILPLLTCLISILEIGQQVPKYLQNKSHNIVRDKCNYCDQEIEHASFVIIHIVARQQSDHVCCCQDMDNSFLV